VSLLQPINHSFAKSAPLILGVCLFDIVVATSFVSCENLIDVHGASAGDVRVFCLFDILAMLASFGKSLPDLTSAAPSNAVWTGPVSALR
jgi:hypothetical protein